MIERVYLKEYVTFDEVELEISNGLIVFTGPSGAGKSVLFRGILSIFGYFEGEAKVAEALLNSNLDLSEYGIEGEDEFVFREVKKAKTRYFINNQAVSKKSVKEISKLFIDYLSVRSEFENILEVLDKIGEIDLSQFKREFLKYRELKKRLEEIEKAEVEAEEKKEFLKFEIEKIEKIAPKEGEFEELMQIKKDLSRLEKIKEKSNRVAEIFNYEDEVYEFLEMMDEDSEFFSSAMNELRVVLERVEEKAEFLESIEIEEVLDRLSSLQELIKKYGSIDKCLEVLEEKRAELHKLENLSFEKEHLIEELNLLEKNLLKKGEEISKKRQKSATIFKEKLNLYLKRLYMPQADIKFERKELGIDGIDRVEIVINEIDTNTISTGEYNRLRVAVLAAKLEYEDENKSLFLDEVDANLSGEEAMSVAEVLKYLSSKYQVFAISHQAQLASLADKHFFVSKEGQKSYVKELSYNDRLQEVARIIGGKEVSNKAVDYARELLGEKDG